MMFVLASDIVSDLLPPVVMDFLIPGIIAGFILTYVFYKLGQSWGWI